jgi:hypothetical protein
MPYYPRYNKPVDHEHEGFDDCTVWCGCPGLGLPELERGQQAVVDVLGLIGQCLTLDENTHHFRKLDALTRLIDRLRLAVERQFPVGYRLNAEDLLRDRLDFVHDERFGFDEVLYRLRWMQEWLGEALKQPEAADERHVQRDFHRIGVIALDARATLRLLGEMGRVEQGDLWWEVLETTPVARPTPDGE